jgi:hypothetical protein
MADMPLEESFHPLCGQGDESCKSMKIKEINELMIIYLY